MAENLTAERQIARITVLAKVDYLPATMAFVRDISSKLGLADDETGRLELVVEEACVNVIEHAFDPKEEGCFDVVIMRKPGQIVVSVEDQGLPFDVERVEEGKQTGLGVVLMNAFADEVRFLNLGRLGKRVELVKNLSYEDVKDYLPESEKGKDDSPPLAPMDIPVTARLMTTEDLASLARCVYRSYGYTYSQDYIYYPDRVKEMMDSGLLISCVLVTPDQEVIGHGAMSMHKPDACVMESGQMVVDPRFRSRGLTGKMADFMVNYIRERGTYGFYGEAVTVHPFSQKVSLSLGGTEMGLFLGFTPATMFFKDIQDESQLRRQSTMLMYTRLNGEPPRDVYPPFHHRSMIERIYKKGKQQRNLISLSHSDKRIELEPVSQLDVCVQPDPGRAYMSVIEFGKDLEELVKFRLRELCLRRIDCIYLDLPLSHPETARVCAVLEMLGFFFAGVIPEFVPSGDVLRLQYLNNVDINPDDIHTASDFGREMLDYVIKLKEVNTLSVS